MLRNTRFHTYIALAWILSSFIARHAAAQLDCDNVLDLEPNTVWRSEAWVQEKIFRWSLPSPGIATVDLLAAGSSSSWLEIRSDICRGKAADVWVVEQSDRHLVLAVRSAGNLYIAPEVKASGFRLITSFTPAEIVEKPLNLAASGMRGVQTSFFAIGIPVKTEPEVLDPDPDGQIVDPTAMLKTEPEILDPDPDGQLVWNAHLLASVLTLEGATGFKTEPEILDPDPDGQIVDPSGVLKTEPEILDPDPDGQIAHGVPGLGAGFRQVLVFEPICRPTELDDHGDTMSCATPLALGRDFTGELANGWGDDRDVFSFQVNEVATVELLLVAEVRGFAVELTDAAGQRLATERLEPDDGTSAHLASTLAPGRYFFHVNGAAGAFAITARTSD